MLICCRQHKILAANGDSLRTTQFQQRMRIHCRQHNFGSECWFAVNNTISVTNTDSLQTTQNFSSECWFNANNTISAANADSLQTTHFQEQTPVHCGQHTWTQIQKWTLDSLRTTQFGNEHVLHCGQHNSTANTWFVANNTIRQRTPTSLQTTQIRRRKPDSLQTTQFAARTLV